MSKLNLIQLLRDLFKKKVVVPEEKYRVRVIHKHTRVVAEVWESERWNKIKICELEAVSIETAIQRCKQAIETYKTLGVSDTGEVSL